ncbi:hypothetical protein RCG67_10965 [Kocuria sp. CPCC 205292]|uniref:hypothetical protein n=1 Tax=Kocuria cellulosilytica TaxID=3071451 RepID=UPI0034D4C5DE
MSEVVAPPSGRTYLMPDDAFPADLTELSLAELHVLHSRVGRQLDREYLGDAAGAHPVTLERHQELTVELDAREIAHPQRTA